MGRLHLTGNRWGRRSGNFRWDPSVHAWAPLDAGYDDAIARGVAMALGEQPPGLLRLPLPAASEAAP